MWCASACGIKEDDPRYYWVQWLFWFAWWGGGGGGGGAVGAIAPCCCILDITRTQWPADSPSVHI